MRWGSRGKELSADGNSRMKGDERKEMRQVTISKERVEGRGRELKVRILRNTVNCLTVKVRKIACKGDLEITLVHH